MSQVIRVALLGVTGRLGRAIGRAVLQAPDFALTGISRSRRPITA